MKLTNQPWLHDLKTQTLLKAFADKGIELRFVGGCVRDAVMGRAVGDIDCATPAPPKIVTELLDEAGLKAVPTGIAHGTVTAVVDGKPFEITTLRKDVACDGRHAEVTYTDDWQEDALRRDFTLNALYCDAEGTIYDYTDGMEAAKAGHIQFIGDANQRIQEDALRILRFFRFHATHGAGVPDAVALKACAKHKAMLDALSGERIQQEMLKLLAAENPSDTLTHLQKAGIMPHIIGIKRFKANTLSRLVHIDHPLQRDPIVRLVAILRSERGWFVTHTTHIKRAEAINTRWKLSNQQQSQLNKLLLEPFYGPPAYKWREKNRYDLGLSEDELKQLTMLSAACQSIDDTALHDALTQPTPMPTFPLAGQDLINEGISPGPQIGKILTVLEDDWHVEDFEGDKDYWLKTFRELNSRPPHHRPW